MYFYKQLALFNNYNILIINALQNCFIKHFYKIILETTPLNHLLNNSIALRFTSVATAI